MTDERDKIGGDLGRIELRVASAVPGPEEVEFNAVNAYREAIENFCETLLPECDDLINRAFDSGKREVLRAVARGLSNAEIAQSMYASESTIKTHLGAVLRKLGLRDRVQVVVFAHEHELTPK